MKIKCDFCKTEYNLDRAPMSPVKCAVCGHTWHVSVPARRANVLVFFAACCAAFAAIVFTVVVMMHARARHPSVRPLIATLDNVEGVVDDGGAVHFVVRGTITNQSEEIYGVPDIIVYSHDAGGNIIARQKFLPPATLLDPGRSVGFSHTLASPAAGVKKITVELANIQDTGAKK